MRAATTAKPMRAAAGTKLPARATHLHLAAALGLTAGLAALAITSRPANGQTPQLSVNDFSADFSAMAKLKPLVAKGMGKIGVLLPETTTSARYTSFDAPYLKKAFAAAGLAANQVIITNAQGSEATELTQAQSAISQGATVLLMDPISSGVGGSIEAYAKQHGVPVIDYDRLTLGGSRAYYVSFNNVKVGELIGKGMEACLADWKIAKPQNSGDARRAHRQQRDPVRARLHGRAAAEVQLGRLHQGRRARWHLGSLGGAHDLRATIHGALEHQRRCHAQ